MKLRDLPIRRKLTAVIMLTSVTVLVLTVAAFLIYDLVTFREAMARNLTTLGRVVADNSSAALAFRNDKDAAEILQSLRAEPQIVAAAIFDEKNELFITFPPEAPANSFDHIPRRPRGFYRGHLFVFEPVTQNGARLGTLALKADLRLLYNRLRIYAGISLLIVLGSVAVALGISSRLQKMVSDPILALASTARHVSDRADYSVRAAKHSGDELGLLTEAFNQMLTRIQEQTVAIQEGAERLRLSLEASRTGTWDWDLKTGRIAWDDYQIALFGLKRGEFQGTYEHFIALVHPEDRDLVTASIKKALQERKSYSIEYRAVWPDHTVHDMASQGKAFYSETGEALRMTGVTQDVTERKRGEAAARRLAAIVESSDDAIISTDLNGVIASWNQGAERLLGYSASEVIGKSVLVVVPPERHEEENFILARIRFGEATEHYETQRLRKDGTLVDVSLSVSPVRDSQNRIIGVSKISRDITDMKRAQEALERQAHVLREQAQMLDLASVMARDLNDRIFLWNTGLERLYGWERTETLGRIFHEVLKTRFPQPLDEIRTVLMRDGKWEGELIHTAKDGRQVTVSSYWVLHRDPKGQPRAILEVDTDITERKRAEQQILQMNVELERRVQERTAELTAANQELEAFTYSVAHDLRAPLRHIDAFTKILFDDYAPDIPPEAQRYLQNIRRGSQNMSRLVDDLLNLARVGRQELKRELTPLSTLVDDIIHELKRDAGQRRIEWHVGRLPTVETDPGLMKQVFANLLGNAVKYTRPREKAVIEVGQKQINGETVIFIRDNGVGFSMKYADKLFGVFQRLHRAEEFEGTGVGLAIVDRIIRKHGGHIWAEAEVDRGATFYFTFNGLKHAAKAA